MNNKIIVADASPLIAFGRIKQIPLLAKTLGTIIIPEIVASECLNESHRPGAVEIQQAVHNKIILITPDNEINKNSGLSEILDHGEASAISLALQIEAGLLIDEKIGRDVARKLNLKIIGTAGALLLAKKKKLVNKIAPLIMQLKQSGYYLSSALIAEILKQAKEHE